jgi:hypothetical protein
MKNSQGKDVPFNFTLGGKVSVKEYGIYTAFFSLVNYPHIKSDPFILNFIDKTVRLKFLDPPDRFNVTAGKKSINVI